MDQNPAPTPDDLDHVAAGLGDDLDTMVVYNLLRTAAHLGPLVEAALREQSLTASQLNALLVLRHAGAEGLRMGAIGERLVVTKSNVTGLVDRLEARGLVVRVPQPDRRATLVRLTADGAALVEAVRPRHAAAMAVVSEGLAAEDRRHLVATCTALRRELRRRPREGV